MADQVRLTIEEDTGAPPGHARLCFEGLAPPADARFKLRRLDAEPEHLGPHGWQNSPALLEPDAVVEEGGTTVFQVGPEVVDRMAADAPIALELPAAGVSLRSYWPDIAPSAGDADQSVALSTGAAIRTAAPARPAPPPLQPAPQPVAQIPVEPPPPPKPPPPPPPEPEPPPQPIPPPEPEPEPIHVQPPEPEPTPPPPRPDAGSRRWLPLALGLLALMLIIGGTWQLGLLPWPVSDEEPAADGEIGPAPEPQPPESEPQPRPQPEPEPEPQPEPARDWRAELLEAASNGAPAEELFELGQGAAAAGELETALLAYEEAMRQGHGPALMAIGRWYDPASYSAESSPFSQPNPEQAASYYRRAGEAGVEEADEALRALCSSSAGAAWAEQSCPPAAGE